VPVPRDNEVLIRVGYTAINRADTLQRKYVRRGTRRTAL